MFGQINNVCFSMMEHMMYIPVFRDGETPDRMSPCTLIANEDHKHTIHIHSVTAVTHVIALEAG